MANPMTVETLGGIWARKIRPLPEEYFFDQPEIVASEFKPDSLWPELGAD